MLRFRILPYTILILDNFFHRRLLRGNCTLSIGCDKKWDGDLGTETQDLGTWDARMWRPRNVGRGLEDTTNTWFLHLSREGYYMLKKPHASPSTRIPTEMGSGVEKVRPRVLATHIPESHVLRSSPQVSVSLLVEKKVHLERNQMKQAFPEWKMLEHLFMYF